MRPEIRRTAASIASRQHGVVAKRELRHAGLRPYEIRRLVEEGGWEARRRATYTAAAAPWTWQQMVLEACKAAEAVAFRRTAARLFELAGCTDERVELLVVHERRVRQRGLVVHRTRRLPGQHLTSVAGIPTTSVPRTLADLGGVVRPLVVETALEDALRRRLTTLDEVLACALELRARGRPGPRVLLRILARRGLGPPTESPPELLAEKILLHPSLPVPVRQYPVRTKDGIKRIDFAYPHLRLGIEYDGSHHLTPLERIADRQREIALAAEGWQLVRLEKTALRRPRQTRADVAAGIEARTRQRVRARPRPGRRG